MRASPSSSGPRGEKLYGRILGNFFETGDGEEKRLCFTVAAQKFDSSYYPYCPELM